VVEGAGVGEEHHALFPCGCRRQHGAREGLSVLRVFMKAAPLRRGRASIPGELERMLPVMSGKPTVADVLRE
jgi:hypothetical protein